MVFRLTVHQQLSISDREMELTGCWVVRGLNTAGCSDMLEGEMGNFTTD